MSRRRIGQESFGLDGRSGARSSPDDRAGPIDRVPVERAPAGISSAVRGEPAWPPLALFQALLISVWYDLSDVKLAEALEDRASFRRFSWLPGPGAGAGAERLRALSRGRWWRAGRTGRCPP